MSLTPEEREFIYSQPKRVICCPKLQAEKDKKLRAALAARFGVEYCNEDTDQMADLAMQVIKEQRR